MLAQSSSNSIWKGTLITKFYYMHGSSQVDYSVSKGEKEGKKEKKK